MYKPVLQTTVADFESHWRVNVLGPVVLFQAFYPLLLKSTKTEKKFVITSTAAGSIGIAGSLPFPVSAYGSSKAAINFVAAKIHQEHGDKDKLVVIPIHPGKYDRPARKWRHADVQVWLALTWANMPSSPWASPTESPSPVWKSSLPSSRPLGSRTSLTTQRLLQMVESLSTMPARTCLGRARCWATPTMLQIHSAMHCSRYKEYARVWRSVYEHHYLVGCERQGEALSVRVASGVPRTASWQVQ